MESGISHCLSLAIGRIINDHTILTRGAYLLSTDEADIGVLAPPTASGPAAPRGLPTLNALASTPCPPPLPPLPPPSVPMRAGARVSC